MPEPMTRDAQLGADFTQRLRGSLESADRRRRRRAVVARLRLALPAVLLVGPVLAWHLMNIAPGSFAIVVGLLAQWMLVLNVGVHVDTSLLRYLGLQALPSVVGVLLLIVITGWLLAGPRNDE